VRHSARALLSWLLRSLLLFAALYLCRGSSAVVRASPLRHRRGQRQRRGGLEDCQPATPGMADRPDHPSWGFGLCPREGDAMRSEEHTSELQSRFDLVCRLLLEKKKILTA